MGHKHDQEVPITQENVNESIASGLAQPHEGPDSQEMMIGHGLLGRAVRVNIARMLTVLLCNFDLGTGTYWGKVLNANPAESSKGPFEDGASISGLRPYPYAAEPNYAFQFVFPGADESVLRNIARDNLAATHAVTPDEVPDEAPVTSNE